jgi:putative ABC transport system substrate-binding protein
MIDRRTYMGRLAAWVACAGLTTQAVATERRRIGVLLSLEPGDPEGAERVSAFRAGLAAHGWIDGHNIEIIAHYAGGSLDRLRAEANRLITRRPEVVLAAATTALVALKQATDSVPIVFAQVTDPVGAGFVGTLAKPGGNITGVTQHDFSIGGKWLELIREVSPALARVGILFDPSNPATAGYISAIEQSAATTTVVVSRLPATNRADILRAIDDFGAGLPAGLIILPGPIGAVNREIILDRAAAFRMPTVFPFRYHVVSGGLISYGVANIGLYRQSAWHVDRILKGERPAELPVQNALSFELVLNLKTARSLGLAIPPSILIRADEVIE